MTVTTRPPMTERQREVLDFIRANMSLRSPTVREIAAHFGISSPNGVTTHLTALERKGYVRKAAGHARGIEVVDGD